MKKIELTGFFTAVIYLSLVIWAAVSAARIGFGDFFAVRAVQTKSIEDAETAGNYDSENPEIPQIKGILLVEKNEFADAESVFKKSAALGANDFHIFMRIGYAQMKLGKFEEAQTNFNRAIELAPFYAKPRRYLGRFLLETGRLNEAFESLRDSSELDLQTYPELLHLGRKKIADDARMLELMTAVSSPEARKMQAFYFIKHHLMTENLRGYLSGNQISLEEKNRFIAELLKKKDYQEAVAIWKMSHKSVNEKQDLSSFLINNDFEEIRLNSESGLGWQTGKQTADLEFSFDQNFRYKGSHSLSAVFNGETPIRSALISQTAYLKENSFFRLNFAFSTKDIVSGSSSMIVVSDPDLQQIFGQYELKKTEKGHWQTASVQFKSPADGVISISLIRQNCQMIKCPIFGRIWLDNFSIIRMEN